MPERVVVAPRRARPQGDEETRTLRALADRLRAAGYTAEALRLRLGISSSDEIGLLNHAASLERLGTDRSPEAALIRTFFLEADTDARTLRRIWPRGEWEGLTSIGLVHVHGQRVRARLRIDPVAEQYMLADRRFRQFDRRALRLPNGDPVYPPSGDS